MIDQEIESKIKQLEQQHSTYMNHVNMQINGSQQQMQTLQQSESKRLLFLLFHSCNNTYHHHRC